MPAAPSDLNDVASFGLTGRAGDVVFREGETGADLFVVQKGRIELLKADANGGLHRIAACGVGDVFGERSLFDEAVRDVTARALTDFTVLRIDRPTFDRITQEDPGIVRAMLARLASRPWDVEVAAAPAGGETAAARPPAKRAARTGGASAPAAEGGTARAARHASLRIPSLSKEIALPDGAELWVGRRDSATKFIPEVDLTDIDEQRSLSRRHAQFVRRDGRLFLREVKATRNGTFVNGQRIEPGADVELSDGDRLQFGLVDAVLARTG